MRDVAFDRAVVRVADDLAHHRLRTAQVRRCLADCQRPGQRQVLKYRERGVRQLAARPVSAVESQVHGAEELSELPGLVCIAAHQPRLAARLSIVNPDGLRAPRRSAPRGHRPALPAVSLTTDTSVLTAFSNDVGFDGVFARQIQALGRPGDVLVAISTSGRSRNVVLAAEVARGLKMCVVALTGSGAALRDAADVNIAVPSDDTQFVQEAHLAVEHAICAMVEGMLFDERGRR